MNFTYAALFRAWENDSKIGNWRNKPVYAMPQLQLENAAVNGVYYVVYDDGNKLVGLNYNNQFVIYGTIDDRGNVDEYDMPKRYDLPSWEKEESQTAEEPLIADVKIGIDVDATLKAAREMTVESLLDGFNYGL